MLICTLVATIAAQTPRSQGITLPVDQAFTNADRQVVAMSPDGTRFAYVANARLFMRTVGDGQPVEIAGTAIAQGVSSPVFSPDGRSMAFWSGADRMLKRIAVSGGAATTIGEADNPFGMSWASNDTLLVGQGPKGILRVPASGGTAETIVTVKDGELAYGPQMLPGGNAVLFTLIDAKTALAASWDKVRIVVQSLGGAERKTVVEAGRDARYVSTGDLTEIYYQTGQRMFAVTFQNGLVMFGRPRELPISGFVQPNLRRNFDQTPDGKQFLMVFRSAARVEILPKWNDALEASR
ncbi:MAG: hypothetical protein A3G76_16550 [Acidobacteria bacterium RIFCSPLOWO2_12_FULL_65_11]|nr:MAG: hypothetical protein A3H95_15060 [Acidobacteria bacterium RIFCSPLOWO2_02_FULL_64_15]OFW28161.1 MAG: hypothetical protein A3G76_16550 [Acidobacteria bacterium RIFCSPLOWO2_12_FULL_65_11]